MDASLLDRLLSRLDRWIDTTDLRRALPRQPRVIVLLGRTGAGKTTLVNRLANTDRPTGLGGVTRSIEPVNDGSILWVDTPGIDDPDKAIDLLSGPLDQAHGAIWVVDGLQPATHTERTVVELVVPPGLPVQVVVSRADLFPDERDSVRRRVIEVTRRTAVLLDLRRDPLPDLRHWGPTPAETAALDQAVRDALEALRRQPAPVDPTYLARQLDLRTPVAKLLADLAARDLNFPDLMQAYRDGFAALAAGRVVAWTADPHLGPYTHRMPELPPTPDPTSEPLEVLRLSAAGAVNSLRELKSVASSWVMEAQVALSDWVIPTDAAAAAEHAALLAELQSTMSTPMVSERGSTG